MTDHIIIKAEDRLRAIELERRELEAFIATYRKLTGDLPVMPLVPSRVPAIGSASVAAKVERRPSSTREIVDAAMEALAAHGSPMKLGEIYQALIGKGVVITGKIPPNNLGAKLSADKRLQSFKGLGWWFRDENPHATAETHTGRDLEDYYPNEEDPDVDDAEPSFKNGATGVHPGETATHAD